MLRIFIMLGNDFYFGSHQKRGVEPNTKLSDQINISSFKVFQKFGCSWFCNSSEVSDELAFGHSNAIVNDFNNFSVVIILNLNFEFGLIS